MSIPAETMCPAVREVLETMYFMDPVYKGAGEPPAQSVAASLRFSGACEGEFRVAVNRDLARRMTAEFLAADPSAVTADQVSAAVRELANVTCGAALNRWMPDADFRIAIPSMLDQAALAKSWPHCFEIDGEGIEVGFDLAVDRN